MKLAVVVLVGDADELIKKHGLGCIPQLMEHIHNAWAQIAFHKITKLEMHTNGELLKGIKMAQNWVLDNLNQEAKNIFKGGNQ